MSGIADAVKALRSVLLMQDDIRTLKDTVRTQGDRLSRLAEAHANLRDRISRLEGMIEGAAMARQAAGQARIEGQP